MINKVQQVNWLGNYSQGSGYSGSAENMVVALEELGIDVRVIGVETDKQTLTQNITPKGLKVLQKPFILAEKGIAYGFPSAFSSLYNKYKIGFTMFETNQMPTTKGGNPWSGTSGKPETNCNLMDEIWVPCEHNVQLMKRSGVKVPVHKVLLGFDPEKFTYIERPERETFTFLILGTLTIRKNVGAVLTAFMNLFRDREDVRLIIKSNSGTVGHLDMPHYPNITVIDEFSTNEQIRSYYEQADCFVFPSRGEGFGLPVIEAMATGLPCIFSNHTGLAEFADENYNYPIKKFRETPAVRYPSKWGNVGTWFDPDWDELKELMAYVESHRDEAREKGRKSSKWVHDNFTYKQTAERIIYLLNNDKKQS